MIDRFDALPMRAKALIIAVTAAFSLLIVVRIVAGGDSQEPPVLVPAVSDSGVGVLDAPDTVASPPSDEYVIPSEMMIEDGVAEGTSDDREYRNREDAAIDFVFDYRGATSPKDARRVLNRYEDKIADRLSNDLLETIDTDPVFDVPGIENRELKMRGVELLAGNVARVEVSIVDTYKDGSIITSREIWTVEFDPSSDKIRAYYVE